MHLVLCRVVVKREQLVPILDQARQRLGVFGLEAFHRAIKGLVCLAAGLGHPDVMNSAYSRGRPENEDGGWYSLVELVRSAKNLIQESHPLWAKAYLPGFRHATGPSALSSTAVNGHQN